MYVNDLLVLIFGKYPWRSKLKIIVDTREQLPLAFGEGFEVIVRKLDTGDYAPDGFEDRCCIERKSIGDLVHSCTHDRPRFNACIDRLLVYESKLLLIEGPQLAVETGLYWGRTNPNSVLGALLCWQMRGLPVFFAQDPRQAALYCAWFMRLFLEREALNIVRSVPRRLKYVNGGSRGGIVSPCPTPEEVKPRVRRQAKARAAEIILRDAISSHREG